MKNKINGMIACTGLLFFSVHGMEKLRSYKYRAGRDMPLSFVSDDLGEAFIDGKEKEVIEHINKYLDTKGDPNAYVCEGELINTYDETFNMVYPASFIHAEPLLCRVIRSVANVGHRESLIGRLVAAKANVNATDRNGKTALQLAEDRATRESKLFEFLRASCAGKESSSAKDAKSDKV